MIIAGILIIIANVASDTMIATGRISRKWIGMSLVVDVVGVGLIVTGLVHKFL